MMRFNFANQFTAAVGTVAKATGAVAAVRREANKGKQAGDEGYIPTLQERRTQQYKYADALGRETRAEAIEGQAGSAEHRTFNAFRANPDMAILPTLEENRAQESVNEYMSNRSAPQLSFFPGTSIPDISSAKGFGGNI